MNNRIGGYLKDIDEARVSFNNKSREPANGLAYKKIKLLVATPTAERGEYMLFRAEKKENNFSVWTSKDGRVSLSVLEIYQDIMDGKLEVIEEQRGA